MPKPRKPRKPKPGGYGIITLILLLALPLQAQVTKTLDKVYYRDRSAATHDSLITQVTIDSSATDTLYFFFNEMKRSPFTVEYNEVLTIQVGADTVGAPFSSDQDSLSIVAKGLYRNTNGTISHFGQNYMMTTSANDQITVTAADYAWGTGYVEGQLLFSDEVDIPACDGVALIVLLFDSAVTQSLLLKNIDAHLGNLKK